jgi:hypothetical protein
MVSLTGVLVVKHFHSDSRRRAYSQPFGLMQHMLAGGVAGIAEHIAMYPVDTVKTRMQALAHPGQRLHGVPLHQAISAIIKREGLWRMYRGVGAVAWSAGYDLAGSILKSQLLLFIQRHVRYKSSQWCLSHRKL